MSVGRQFLLDANVFIQAHQRHYAFDICPGFWQAVERQHKADRVLSIDKVKKELIKPKAKGEDQDDDGEDKLSSWVQERAPATLFKATADKKVIETFGEMVKWVHNERQFTAEAKAEFSRVADGWLVAFAKANDLMVVTHEEYAPEVKRKVPIPNVCRRFDVDYCNTFEMLRNLKEQFVLRKRRRRT